jgi:ATP/maltotriose-dependent transcriptional regulator MalT
LRSGRHALTGEMDQAVRQGLAARGIEQRTLLRDEWNAVVPVVLLRAYTWLEDFEAVDGEVTAALATPSLTEPFKLVLVRGAQALAWFGAGRIAQAAEAARAADADARRLGFENHPFAVDYLRALAGAALERRDFDAAERLAERALSIAEHYRPAFEYLALLDRAEIWAARGQIRQALATVEAARTVLAGTAPTHLARAGELEALLRLALGDLRIPVELASGLPATRRGLLLARVALAANDHHAALGHLDASRLGNLTPRAALTRQILLAAAAIQRGDPRAAGMVGGVLEAARHQGYLHTIVTTAPELTRYLVEHSAQVQPEPFLERIIVAAMEVRAAQTGAAPSGGRHADPLTAAELRVLKLLPTTTYLQIAATLYISHNTVKTHVRSIYQKLGVSSRAEAIERAVDLHLLLGRVARAEMPRATRPKSVLRGRAWMLRYPGRSEGLSGAPGQAAGPLGEDFPESRAQIPQCASAPEPSAPDQTCRPGSSSSLGWSGPGSESAGRREQTAAAGL